MWAQISINGFWSARSIYTGIVILFHLGLVVYPILNLDLRVSDAPMEWLTLPAGPRAIWTSSLGVLSMSLACILVYAQPRSGEPALPEYERELRRVAPRLGSWTVVVSVAAWVYTTASAMGLGFFLASYGAYKSATIDLPMDYIFFGITMGMVLLGTTLDGVPKAALVAFVIFAVLGFPMGLRGEVLFPLVAYALMRARHHPMPRAGSLVVLVLIALFFISGVKELRQTGWGDARDVLTSANPIAGVGELGYTVRTVAEVDQWHQAGELPRNGATYWAPIERLSNRLMPGAENVAAKYDYRLMNVEMRSRAGNLGGSIIAESFRNFGLTGVFVVMFLTGLLCAGIDVASTGAGRQLILGVFFVVLLQHVRNSFTPIPLQLLMGVMLVTVVIFIARSIASVSTDAPNRRAARA
ncbi:O-antigen polysaccharide polymerase Wzy [Nocardioides sp. AE5]|uniref:O-antigen polysaccharide polymerase Wzy n=1 Tax=Nocardioides sp. AE5 TaxID=2962573 RepID=UPI0028817F82|nr:O-antigen polysaccharide polymerase Wzy [Nocardioides sp. AE5]MDT0202639.1 O-antigen polysaccharide polymerase Wzy [Nocardioides sp. AE5]